MTPTRETRQARGGNTPGPASGLLTAKDRLHIALAIILTTCALALLQLTGPEPANPADAKVTPATAAPPTPFDNDQP